MEHITKALERRGFPSWTIKKMKEQQIQKQKNKEKKEKNTEKSQGMVTLPYVKGATEPVQRILKHHKIITSVRPHQNIRKLLVHPKAKWKIVKRQTMYNKSVVRAVTTHISAKQRTFGTRLKEHKKEIENITTR